MFDFAAVELKEDRPLAAYYVTTTSSAVILITLVSHTLLGDVSLR